MQKDFSPSGDFKPEMPEAPDHADDLFTVKDLSPTGDSKSVIPDASDHADDF